MEPIISATPPANGGDVVKATNTASFEADVITASKQTPIIVDFWAPWCGPCKQLGPALEKVVRATNGAVRMVKVNVDENQELAGQLRVQSIPAVFAFKDGQPVDGFVGAVPESQLKAFVDKLMAGTVAAPSPIEEALNHANTAFDSGDHSAAAEIYGQILAHDPTVVAARAGLIRCAVALGDLARARQALDELPGGMEGDSGVASARVALELAEQGQGAAGETRELEERLARDGNDHRARYDLALALYGGGNAEGAIDQLLELVRRNRAWDEEAGRKQLLKIFEALGPTHELTLSGRRSLSSILFS
jgi:putative thioredoxin